jgi:hypothetical protein
MKRSLSLLTLFLLLLMMPAAAHAQAWSGIISPSRATDWSTAGIPGGIPSGSWTQCGSTIAAYGTSGMPTSPATITNAIAACGTNQYVLLGPGQFYLNNGIDFASKSNVVLRGSGPNSTFIHISGSVFGCNGFGSSVCIAGSNSSAFGGVTDANWTAGYSQNATTITLSAIGGAVVGVTPIILDQCNTGYRGNGSNNTCTGAWADNGGFYVCDQSGSQASGGNPSIAGCDTQTPAGTYWPLRSQQEVVVVSQCDGNSTPGHVCSSGTSITISPGIRAPNWASGLSPKAHIPTATITNSGIENLYLDQQTTNNEAIVMFTSSKCWVKNVASHYANFYHVVNFFSSHNVIRDSYFYWTDNAFSESYGIGGFDTGDLLMENNIFQGVSNPIVFSGPCPGCVAAYNFSVNNYFSGSNGYMFPIVDMHAAGINDVLVEGNIGSYFDSDDVHGHADMSTIFRNYFNGMEANNGNFCHGGPAFSCQNHQALEISVGARYYNVLGNVLGTSNYDTTYQCADLVGTATPCVNAGFAVYDITYPNPGNYDFGNNPAHQLNDPKVSTTLFRWGNCDTVTAGCNFNSSEVPTGDAFYPNSIPGSHTLPASFYNGVTTAFPGCGTGLSYWKNPTSGTCPPYPPTGPDTASGSILRVTSGPYTGSRVLSSANCGGCSTTPDNVGHANPNPAMIAYFQMGGTPDGTGGMLTFNPSAYYANDSGGTVSQPTPPTNLSATVQ